MGALRLVRHGDDRHSGAVSGAQVGQLGGAGRAGERVDERGGALRRTGAHGLRLAAGSTSSLRSAAASVGAPPTASGRTSLAAPRSSRSRPSTAAGASGGFFFFAISAARAAGVDRLQHADRQQVRDHRGAAHADVGKRNAGDRRDTHRHADVHEELEEERDDDPARRDRPEVIAGHGHHLQASPHDEQVEQQQDRAAHEPALLGERREREVGVVLGQEVEVRLRRAGHAAAPQAARADGRQRLLRVVVRAALVLVRAREAGQSLHLVRLDRVHADRRQEPQHVVRAGHREDPQPGEVRPARAGREEHRAQRRAVDERRPQVGLHEDEQHRPGGEHDRGDDGAQLVDSPAALGEEAGQGEHDEHLAELGRLEAERAEVEPAPRVPRHPAGQEHEQHHAAQRAVQHAPVPPVQIRVDEHEGDQTDAADRRVDALAEHVVVRVAGDVVPRDPGDRPEPVAERRGDRGEQHPVEPADRGADRRAVVAPVRDAAGALVEGLDHQSVFPVCAAGALRPNQCSNTRSAAGAAAVPPWPPFSMSAQTTIEG